MRTWIEGYTEKEMGTVPSEVEKAKVRQMESQRPLDEAEKVIGGFRVLLDRVNKDWKKPTFTSGVGEYRFTTAPSSVTISKAIS